MHTAHPIDAQHALVDAQASPDMIISVHCLFLRHPLWCNAYCRMRSQHLPSRCHRYAERGWPAAGTVSCTARLVTDLQQAIMGVAQQSVLLDYSPLRTPTFQSLLQRCSTLPSSCLT
jgi:hypothetical protein